jgi:hypothetical protein
MHMTPLDEKTKTQSLTLTAIGDNGEISKVISPDSQSGIAFSNNEETGRCHVDVYTRYASKHIVNVCSVSPVSRNVRIYLSSQSPLKLQFQVPDVGMFYFFLCPKIEEDD